MKIYKYKNTDIIAFSMENNGSFRINKSQVLLDLNLQFLKQALQRTRQESHSRIGASLLKDFQQK